MSDTADTPTITVKVDQTDLNAQVQKAMSAPMKQTAAKLIAMAMELDPDWFEEHDTQVIANYEAEHREAPLSEF